MKKTKPLNSLKTLALLCTAGISLLGCQTATMNTSQSAADEHHELPMVKPPALFEPLKQLAGNWKGTQDTPDGKKEVAVEYNLSSADTILTEKLFPGKPHEMFSIYHGDTDRVLMTHYCAFGNQPRMKMVKTNHPNTYKFVYMDGTSIRSIKEPHMHQLTLTMLNKNHITHEWIFYENGKPAQTVTFDLKRVK